MEAGIGSLTRLGESAIDVTLVVVEPTPRSIDVARRGLHVADERGQGRVVIVANKISDDADRQRIIGAFGDRPTVFVPEDPAIDAADRRGTSPSDDAPDAPGVQAIEHIIDGLGLPDAVRG
ncbi:MAG: hypothetical protein HKN44_16155 [Ilumatobacter sp.]|nr:hypothetical protein [Ilumatobacter sp.]